MTKVNVNELKLEFKVCDVTNLDQLKQVYDAPSRSCKYRKWEKRDVAKAAFKYWLLSGSDSKSFSRGGHTYYVTIASGDAIERIKEGMFSHRREGNWDIIKFRNGAQIAHDIWGDGYFFL